jgi:glycosyltransferase involved in cell wall biosynthesis
MAGGRFAAAAAEVAAWARPAYDLVWCWRPHSVWVAPPVGPIVLDHDDLEDGKIRARLAALAATPRSLGRRLRDAAAGVQARADARRWRTVQRRVASGVAAVSVCSETDRVRLELASAVVIPNGYQLEGEPVGGAPALHDPPTLLFQGSLVRPPNADAVSVLLREVMPLVWERRPEVRVLLAGRADDTIRRQAADPRVEVTGWVRDMTGQLARADAVVTPIRYGGGTRLKILEAFAHRLPVVSTPAGAEGLDAEDGRHLLLADQSARFAEAVLRLLADEPLRVRLAEEAFALYEARYRWDAIRRRMRGLARTVAGRTPEVKVR